MKAFLIELENRPGGLARIAEALGDRGINITTIAGTTSGDRGAAALMTNDEPGTTSALQAAGLSAREVDVIGVSLAHQPGTLAAAVRRLANAGINIELLLPTDVEGPEVAVAIGVTDVEGARRALGELVAAG